jgi:thioredoxin-like negative regulator of GroEL
VEAEFLNYVTKLKRTVVHFFHKDFQRCKIMEKHLKILCQQFPQTQFLCMNAEKSLFFVNKLSIRSLPTLCIFIDGVLKDKILGFEGLSGDEFLTWELAAKLSQSGVIENPKEKIKDKTLLKGQRIRGE